MTTAVTTPTLAIRPESKTAATVAFGMGSAFRGAQIAGLKTEGI
jgi:hypothetical protein